VSTKLQRFKVGDQVIVNTGGADFPGTVSWDKPPNTVLKDCYLIAFENGTAQWINVAQLRAA
jgi:hypothetical protein